MKEKKPRPLVRDISTLRDARLIIIATEGEKTEAIYFSDRFFSSKKTQVKVLPTNAGKSAPNWLSTRLREYSQEYDIGPEDQCWLVLDVDRWPEKSLGELVSEARKQNWHVAISNPCFELWFLLHVEECRQKISNCDINQKLIEYFNGYNKARPPITDLLPHLDTAMSRAMNLDSDTSTTSRWPDNPGTRVYELIKEILCKK